MKSLLVRVAVVIGCLLGLVWPQPTGKSDGLGLVSIQTGRFRSWSGLESAFYNQPLAEADSSPSRIVRITPSNIVDRISYDLSVINGPVLEPPLESALVEDLANYQDAGSSVASSTKVVSTSINQTPTPITARVSLVSYQLPQIKTPPEPPGPISDQLMASNQKTQPKTTINHQPIDTSQSPAATTKTSPQPPKPAAKPVTTRSNKGLSKTTETKKTNQDPNNLCRLAYNYNNWSADIAYAVCMAESQGKATATNNRDRHRGCVGSHGLFQIACIHAPKADMYDPVKNVAMANKIYSRKNSFKPWGAYTNGSYRQYLPR